MLRRRVRSGLRGVEEVVQKRKLIEVALPLEVINTESAHEKSVPRKGHPATLHLWWARRPLSAARALLFAQLVDDPSSRPEEFSSESLQRAERERLHGLIERLAKWENTTDTKLMTEAYAEISRSNDGKPPVIVDPFAGRGDDPAGSSTSGARGAGVRSQPSRGVGQQISHRDPAQFQEPTACVPRTR